MAQKNFKVFFKKQVPRKIQKRKKNFKILQQISKVGNSEMLPNIQINKKLPFAENKFACDVMWLVDSERSPLNLYSCIRCTHAIDGHLRNIEMFVF